MGEGDRAFRWGCIGLILAARFGGWGFDGITLVTNDVNCWWIRNRLILCFLESYTDMFCLVSAARQSYNLV